MNGQQLAFLGQLQEGARWLQVREDSGHLVYKAGQLFLVIEEREGSPWLLCWKDGQPPKGWPTVAGYIVHEQYLEEVSE